MWELGELGSLSRKAANVLTKPCGLERGDSSSCDSSPNPRVVAHKRLKGTGQCQYLTFLNHAETEKTEVEVFLNVRSLTKSYAYKEQKNWVEIRSNHDAIIKHYLKRYDYWMPDKERKLMFRKVKFAQSPSARKLCNWSLNTKLY